MQATAAPRFRIVRLFGWESKRMFLKSEFWMLMDICALLSHWLRERAQSSVCLHARALACYDCGASLCSVWRAR